MSTATEVSATIQAPNDEKISKKLDTFYNPVMQLNRDISILLLKALEIKEMDICDPLAGSGIRTIRFLKELPEETINTIHANDLKEDFEKTIKTNLSLSKCDDKKLIITNTEANKTMLESQGYDYIDIDPFGTPNPFLDSAIKRIRRKGILAITATDTAPLCGTYPKACKRKYWATPRRDHLMHEYGLRILIRKCQLLGAQYDKALTPIFSYSTDHYFRIFFNVQTGKTKVDDILKQHEMIDNYGPLWTGKLFDEPLTKKISELAPEEEKRTKKFLSTIAEEAKIDTLGYIDIHELARQFKMSPPKHEEIITKLQAKGFKAAQTHIRPTGIRTTANEKTILKIIK